MSKKLGIFCVTPQLLKAALQLPEDVEIERIFEDPPSRAGLRINIVVSGESLPIQAAREGQELPWVFGEYHADAGAWVFREGNL